MAPLATERCGLDVAQNEQVGLGRHAQHSRSEWRRRGTRDAGEGPHGPSDNGEEWTRTTDPARMKRLL